MKTLDTEWPRLLVEAVRGADNIVSTNKLWAVSTDRHRELESFAGTPLTWKEAAAWEFLLSRPKYHK